MKISKSLLVLLLIGGFSPAIAQQNLFKGDNLLMPSNLIVEYAVRFDSCYNNSADEECTDTIQKLIVHNNQITNVFDIILKQVLDAKVKVIDPGSYIEYSHPIDPTKTLDIKGIKESLGEQTIVRELWDENGNAQVFEEKIEFDPTSLIGIHFIEDWKITANPLSMTKEIIAYSPIRKFRRVSDYYDYQTSDILLYRPFYVLNNQQNKGTSNMKLINRIEYEFMFYAPFAAFYGTKKSYQYYVNTMQNSDGFKLAGYNSPYLNEIGVRNLVTTLIKMVKNGEIEAYNIDGEKIGYDEIEQALGGGKLIVVQAGDFEDVEYEVYVEPKVEEVQSVVFEEEWYINPETLQFSKKVTSIALVRYEYEEEYDYNTDSYRMSEGKKRFVFRVKLK